MLNNILNWFIVSSANPDEYSLTLKGILLAGGGSLLADLQTIGLNVSLATYTTEVGQAAAVIGAVLSTVGLARKIFLTAQAAAAKPAAVAKKG